MATKRSVKSIIEEMQSEVDHYRPPKGVAAAMMKLARAGFSFSGHGTDFYSDDYSVSLEYDGIGYVYVALPDKGKCRVSVLSEVLDAEVFQKIVRGPGTAATLAKKLAPKRVVQKLIKEYR